MTSRTSAGLQAAKKKSAQKIAATKKPVKKPTKTVAASNATKKKAVAPKKPAKPAVKPAVKSPARAPEKKPVPVIMKKAAAPAPIAAKGKPAPVVEDKKAAANAKVASAKKEVQEKVVAGKKPSAETAPATSGKGPSRAAASGPTKPVVKSTAAPVPAPLKVEPKIIETQQVENKRPIIDGDLFSQEELNGFRAQLESERGKIVEKAKRAVEDGGIQIERDDLMDEVDQAAAMEAQNLTFRLLDRDRKLLAEIDHAIVKIDGGDFGYCEGTGEAIPKRRLELRPWCRHSVKYKEKLERMKKSGRGVVDEDEV